MNAYQDVFQRYEKKYLVTPEQYEYLSMVLEPRMVPDRFAQSTIGNIYYDTPDFRLIRRSLDRPAYKEKLRLRTYRTPHAGTEAFVEIKKKFDHVVYKRRIAMPYAQAVDYLAGGPAPEVSQISREIEWFRGFYEGCNRPCASAMTVMQCLTVTSPLCALPSIRTSAGATRRSTWRAAWMASR